MFVGIIFVIMSSKYIQIRQISVILKLQNVHKNLLLISKQSKHLSRAYNYNWFKYLHINAKVSFICRHLNEYSRFWAYFIAILFGHYILYQCYVLYIIFFDDSAPALAIMLYCGCIVEIDALLYLVINHCAQTVKNNNKIQKINHQSYLTVDQQKTSISVKVHHLLKVSLLLYFFHVQQVSNCKCSKRIVLQFSGFWVIWFL